MKDNLLDIESEGNILPNQRFCPICENIITYSSKSKRKRAEKDNCRCRTCSNKSRIGANSLIHATNVVK